MNDRSNLVSPGLVAIGLRAGSKDEVLDALAQLLLQHGAVKPSYPEAVKERERVYPTGLPTPGVGVAIPHSDPAHVLRAAIALATLERPVSFGLMGDPNASVDVEMVMMLAFRDVDGQVGTLQKLVETFQMPGLLIRLKEQRDAAAAAEMLNACLGGSLAADQNPDGESERVAFPL